MNTRTCVGSKHYFSSQVMCKQKRSSSRRARAGISQLSRASDLINLIPPTQNLSTMKQGVSSSRLQSLLCPLSISYGPGSSQERKNHDDTKSRTRCQEGNGDIHFNSLVFHPTQLRQPIFPIFTSFRSARLALGFANRSKHATNCRRTKEHRKQSNKMKA